LNYYNQKKRGQKRMKNKQGISAIIATLILLLLTIVLVGIVWAVVSGIVRTSTEGVSSGAQCFNSALDITSAVCTADGICNASIQRTSGTDTIDGIRVIFMNEAGDSNFTDVEGNVQTLGVVKVPNTITEVANVNEVDAAIYFMNSAGVKSPCPVVKYTEVQIV
jgi:flagellin-like protein